MKKAIVLTLSLIGATSFVGCAAGYDSTTDGYGSGYYNDGYGGYGDGGYGGYGNDGYYGYGNGNYGDGTGYNPGLGYGNAYGEGAINY